MARAVNRPVWIRGDATLQSGGRQPALGPAGSNGGGEPCECPCVQPAPRYPPPKNLARDDFQSNPSD